MEINKKIDIKVSVICTVYNHGKFLKHTLESLINQNTNFDYEIIVHDDASTDNSPQIIETFFNKYPNKIVPIFQKENQFSKGISVTNQIMFPYVRGKYVAFCEGDDYWCDENKLQKQYDFMENNQDVAMCVHNTIRHDLINKKDKLFSEWKEIRFLTDEQIFSDWNVHYSSYFSRKEISQMTKDTIKYWFGDYIRLTVAYEAGKIAYLPDVMSVYNFNNSNGLLYTTTKTKDCRKLELREQYLIEYNNRTNGKYERAIRKEIENIRLSILLFKDIKSKEEFKEVQKKINKSVVKKDYFNKISFKKKIEFIVKYSSFLGYKIFNVIKNKRRRKNGN